jgi:protein subunit release factor B
MSTKIKIKQASNGTESMDFAQILENMYIEWARRHKVGVMSLSFNGETTIDIEVEPSKLMQEHGIHRLCRVSPHDSQGRRWTSFASIEVEGCDKPLERLRSYTLDPYKQALDLKKRYSTENVADVLAGGVELDKMMSAAVGELDIPGAEGAFIERRTLTEEEIEHARSLVPTIEP